MLNIEFKYKDIKPYQQIFKPTNKNNVPLLHEMHLSGMKQFPQKQKIDINKLYEFPAPKSKQRGITRYDLRYTTGQIPNFNYKIEDIVEVDENEILENFKQDKATAKVNYVSVKPMSWRQTQLNNMKEEAGVPNPLTALRANAEQGIGIDEYKEKTNKIMDDFERFKNSIIANKHIDEDGKRIAINTMEKYKKQGIQHPNSKGVFKDTDPEETKQFLDIMENAGKKLQIQKASNILKQPQTQSTPTANAVSEEKKEQLSEKQKAIQEVYQQISEEEEEEDNSYLESRKKAKQEEEEREKEAIRKNALEQVRKEEFEKLLKEEEENYTTQEEENNIKSRELYINNAQTLYNKINNKIESIPNNQLQKYRNSEEYKKDLDELQNSLKSLEIDYDEYLKLKNYTNDTFPKDSKERGRLKKQILNILGIINMKGYEILNEHLEPGKKLLLNDRGSFSHKALNTIINDDRVKRIYNSFAVDKSSKQRTLSTQRARPTNVNINTNRSESVGGNIRTLTDIQNAQNPQLKDAAIPASKTK
jgi:hypothetical protein